MKYRFERFKEFFGLNRRLVIAVVVALIGVIGLQSFLEISSQQCLGIADSKETTIAFETPVTVKRVFVIAGQSVKKGQPLVEVEPVEINLKLMEVLTELESLKSERKVRDALLGTLGRKAPDGDDPLSRQIAGFQRQADELKRQQGLAVRYAEEDGVVATVAYRPREQVPPFMPVITLTPNSPNLVYGFIHENRAAEFRLGDRVIIEPVADPSRFVEGRVISMGSRIAPFPERFQTGTTQRPTYFGRELVVTMPLKNQVLIGEKVQIRASGTSVFKELGFHAFADSQNDIQSSKFAEGVPFEAGGMVYLPETKSLLVVSDDFDKGGSPFWIMPMDHPESASNVALDGVKKVDDLESVTRSGAHFYSMSSLSKSKKDKIKPERNLIIRFGLDLNGVQVDRALDMRTPLLEALQNAPFLRGITSDLEELEVESFTMSGADGYMALKQPQMPDGSSIIIRLTNLAAQIEAGSLSPLDLEMYTMIKLETRDCKDPARVTDLVKTDAGLYILSNCKKSEQTGQLWFLANNTPAQQAVHVTSFRNGRPEGLAFGTATGEIFVSSDNGGEKGSDILKMTLPEAR